MRTIAVLDFPITEERYPIRRGKITKITIHPKGPNAVVHSPFLAASMLESNTINPKPPTTIIVVNDSIVSTYFTSSPHSTFIFAHKLLMYNLRRPLQKGLINFSFLIS